MPGPLLRGLNQSWQQLRRDLTTWKHFLSDRARSTLVFALAVLVILAL